MYDKSQNLSQINYDNTLRELEYTKSLKGKMLNFKNEHIHSENFKNLIDRELYRLVDKIEHLDEIINEQVRKAKEDSQCEIYQSDLQDNIDRLNIRQITYGRIFNNGRLVVSNSRKLLPKSGIYLIWMNWIN